MKQLKEERDNLRQQLIEQLHAIGYSSESLRVIERCQETKDRCAYQRVECQRQKALCVAWRAALIDIEHYIQQHKLT